MGMGNIIFHGTLMAVMLINGCLCFSISGIRDAEYVSIEMQDKEEFSECFLKVAIRGCDTETTIRIFYPRLPQKTSTVKKVNAGQTSGCLPVICTKKDKKVSLSADIDIIGGNSTKVTPDELKEGTTDKIYASEKECSSAELITFTVQCSKNKEVKVDPNSRKQTKLEKVNDEMSFEQNFGGLPFESDDTLAQQQDAFMQDREEEKFDDDVFGKAFAEQQSAIEEPKMAKIQYDTWFQRYFVKTCGHRNAISYVKSDHSNRYEDRIFQFKCKTVTNVNFDHCYWTGYQNGFDGALFSYCGMNYIMNGIYSRYSHHHRDRQFGLLCCRAPHYTTKRCIMSGYANGWDGRMEYGVGGPRIFTGLFSIHYNAVEDRIFKIASCDYER